MGFKSICGGWIKEDHYSKGQCEQLVDSCSILEREIERRRVGRKGSRDETQCRGTGLGAVGCRAGGIGKGNVEAHIHAAGYRVGESGTV